MGTGCSEDSIKTGNGVPLCGRGRGWQGGWAGSVAGPGIAGRFETRSTLAATGREKADTIAYDHLRLRPEGVAKAGPRPRAVRGAGDRDFCPGHGLQRRDRL